jgi:sporulation protein YlmC with PRC-barrel domain
MNMKFHTLALAALSALALSGPALSQVAGGSTTVEASVTESTTLAMGWSVKKTLMGQTVYNEAGRKVGEVEDLIIAPDRSVSYVIVGAGGFVGIGRHDVAVPMTQIRDLGGRLVMAGATPDSIKAMPAFDYATDDTRRDRYAALAMQDIVRGRTALAGLEKDASVASADAQARMGMQITSLRLDLQSAETKLSEMKQASASRWREFETDLNAARARVRAGADKATG